MTDARQLATLVDSCSDQAVQARAHLHESRCCPSCGARVEHVQKLLLALSINLAALGAVVETASD